LRNFRLLFYFLTFFREPSNVPKLSTALHLQFQDFQIEEDENFMAYNFQNFEADCGGLLGLFMGISFLSIVDAILRFVVRVMSRKREQTRVDVEKWPFRNST
jgi:hypothetical protein